MICLLGLCWNMWLIKNVRYLRNYWGQSIVNKNKMVVFWPILILKLSIGGTIENGEPKFNKFMPNCVWSINMICSTFKICNLLFKLFLRIKLLSGRFFKNWSLSKYLFLRKKLGLVDMRKSRRILIHTKISDKGTTMSSMISTVQLPS